MLLDNQHLAAYVCFLIGLVDFAVIPRLLTHVWSKKGELDPARRKIFPILRTSGLLFIALGSVFLLGYIQVP